MKFPFKTLTLATITLAIFAITYISCTKDGGKATTVIKCVTCSNGGSCINDTCRCPAGFEGITCQTLSAQKFLGQWLVDEQGSVTSFQQYSIQIEQSFQSVSTVTIVELYNPYMFTFSSLTANISGDSIYIPTQPLDSGFIVGNGYFIAGNNSTGQFSKIVVRYKVTNTVTGVTNDFGYSSPLDSPSVWHFN